MRIVWLLRAYGLSESAIAEAIHAINRHHCDPTLADGEVMVIAKSAGRYSGGMSSRWRNRTRTVKVK